MLMYNTCVYEFVWGWLCGYGVDVTPQKVWSGHYIYHYYSK